MTTCRAAADGDAARRPIDRSASLEDVAAFASGRGSEPGGIAHWVELRLVIERIAASTLDMKTDDPVLQTCRQARGAS